MGIYRGPGGTGDAVNDAASEALITVQAKDAALAAQAAAEAAQAAAELAETNAETAETNAETAETNAETAATNAANSASAASTSASNAASSASAASTSASNASTSASNAASSASAASTSASNAASSASTATTQATNASNSASAAATSATNASNSASAAATSATNAANSATAAQTAKTAAELAETNAETAEANAETAEANAAASASAAATSASNASTSASNAATSATNASNSASAAATSATNASNSASAAATSATNASNSASAAATSATNAAASYDSFDDRYLGAKSSAPTLDNDGNTLLVGALYFNTTTNEMKVWDGSTWLNAYASLSGALLATNNLSDLNNTATARTNLGVAIGVNVQAWDADLDTWATKTAPSGTVVGTSDSQTLTNKTLTTPVISTISNTGTLTLPTSTDTLVGRATSDTLTNKTIALGSNTVSGTLAQFNTAVTDADLVSIAGSETLTNKTLTSPTINTATISGGTINNAAIGGTTPAAGSFTSLTDSGNLTFTGTGNRITGDFSNATIANRVMFQNSTTNANTSVGILPNGTATASLIDVYNNSDPTNASRFRLNVDANNTYLEAGRFGTGTFLPITMLTGGSERLRIDTSGNVGIGTTSTSFARLTVRSGTSNGHTILGNDYGSLLFETASGGPNRITSLNSGLGSGQAIAFNGSGGTEWMRIDSSGNVMIGTTTARGRLHSTASSFNPISGNVWSTSASFTSSGAFGGGLALIDSGSGYGMWVQDSGGTFAIGQGSATGNLTERMRIDSSGNVGIGVTSMSGKLDVLAGADQRLLVRELGTGAVVLDAVNAANNAYQLLITNGSQHILRTGASERMRIDSSGNVLVNTTGTVRSGKLSLNGDFGSNGNLYWGATGNGRIYSDVNWGCIFQADRASPAANAEFMWQNAGGTERMRIDSSGNVGIGTSSPATRLDVSGIVTSRGSGNAARFSTVDTDVGGATILVNAAFAGAGTPAIQTQTNHPILFATNNTERMRIDSSGNVGIGTSSMNYRFQAHASNPTRGIISQFRNDSSSSQTGAQIQITQNAIEDWVIGQPAGVSAFAVWSGRNINADGTERMRITSGGDICVNTTSPVNFSAGNYVLSLKSTGTTTTWGVGPTSSFGNFYVKSASGTGVALTGTATSWASDSDERFKTEITPFQNAVEKVCSLRAGTGRYLTDDESMSRSFLIAQDVQKVLPEAVDIGEDENKTLQLRYTDVIPLLVASIKEQQVMIEELKQEVALLKSK